MFKWLKARKSLDNRQINEQLVVLNLKVFE